MPLGHKGLVISGVSAGLGSFGKTSCYLESNFQESRNGNFNFFPIKILDFLLVLLIEDRIGIAARVSLKVFNNIPIFTQLFEQGNQPVREGIRLNFQLRIRVGLQVVIPVEQIFSKGAVVKYLIARKLCFVIVLPLIILRGNKVLECTGQSCFS
ncbi:hypothetical protein WL14_29205 [Burkholderia cepacia]|nr:hypothetical protein WJ46_32630 [Burkholderia cepacia]KVQ33000.1 hypothetical protein WK02_10505 [Burkholderia cepacia]KVZ19136.1 hypothetical protein WL14_29205 [Burkholderia cepacia]